MTFNRALLAISCCLISQNFLFANEIEVLDDSSCESGQTDINGNCRPVSFLEWNNNRSNEPTPAYRPNQQFFIRYSKPSEAQIYDITTTEFAFQTNLSKFNWSNFSTYWETSYANLQVDNMSGGIWGAGPAYYLRIPKLTEKLQLTGHTKTHYLTRHDFKRKRYGGPIHFSYAFGFHYNLTENAYMKYNWQHLSNAHQYEYNPTLETNSFSIGYSF